MDEFRQNNRLRGALDAALSGLNGDPALAQRVLRCAEEKPRAAKKLSVGLVFALVALLAATGIAAAAALNLFEKFGQNDRRFAEIAPQTAISAGIFRRSNRENRHCRRVHHQRLLRRRIAAHRLLNSRLFEL